MQPDATEKKELDEIDDGILLRAQKADALAFRDIVERYHKAVYNVLWRMLESRMGQARVEELTQDVFLKIYRALPSFSANGAAKLSTWIITVATRVALNELRRPKLIVPMNDDSSIGDANSACPEKELVRQRNRLAIRNAISSLSPEHRAVFILREYHGLEYAEIASALTIDLGTVKSRLSRSRQALKKTLREMHYEQQ